MSTIANLIAFLILVVTLLLVWRRSWPGRVTLLVVHSVLLAALATTLGLYAGRKPLLLVAAVVLVVKVWAIPRILRRIGAREPVRPGAPGRSAGLSLLLAGGLVVVAYAVMLPVMTAVNAGSMDALRPVPTTGALPLAFATALIGLFLCVAARDVFGQILGFLVFENGVFALALLGTWGLPGIVEAGVFLDVLVIVLIMEGVVVEIRREHDSIEVDRLRELKG